MENDFNFDFDFDINIDDDSFVSEAWFLNPANKIELSPLYKNAKKEASKIKIDNDGDRVFSLIDGSFIFGDLIEALFVENNWYSEKLTMATLSMSQENIDSLKNLLKGKYIKSLTLIVSDYFFAHERHKHGLIPYLYHVMKNYDFQLVVVRSHCKILYFKTFCNKYVVIHGSANLRSSDNIEQIMTENSKQLFDYNKKIFESIEEKYKTINKSLRGESLWQMVAMEQQKKGT